MIIIDFETYSPINIEQGVIKYASHPKADIICMGYKVDNAPVQLWTPDKRFPKELFKNTIHTIYAHNAFFDYNIWRIIGKKYGMPKLSLARWRDSMALTRRYTFPAKLYEAGKVLGCRVVKDRRGSALIKKICCGNPRPKLHRDFTQQDLEDFYAYCMQDVDSTYEILHTLPHYELSDEEQEIWEQTQKINLRGLPIDVRTAEIIAEYVKAFRDELTEHLRSLTKGRVTKITQAKRIAEFCKLPNLQKETVEKILADPPKTLSSNQLELLQLRSDIGAGSTAKFKKLVDLTHEGRIYYNLVYYGANTGRFGGTGFQLHNLPRASFKQDKEVENWIKAFNDFKPISNPLPIAKKLIRSMILAPKGKQLIVADYHAIENFLLLWVADETTELQRLYDGADQYVDMAAFLYNKPHDDITSTERQVGKVIILGAGYTMGAPRLLAEALSWGIPLTRDLAITAVQAYRQKYKNVVKTWYRLMDAAIAAIRSPGKAFKTNKCVFLKVKEWLVLTLPSGRNIFYYKPRLEPGKYGRLNIVYEGINPYSKKWGRRHLIPGTLIENIIQATARDCLCTGVKNVEEMQGVEVIGHIHDEIISEIEEQYISDTTLTDYETRMCTLPSWADGLKLSASGYIGRRFKKS